MSEKKQVSKAVEEFYINQIETTKVIVEKFSDSDEFSPTMLINSLLSLVILPFEKAKKSNRKKIFPDKYQDLEKKLGILPQVFSPIKSCKNGEIEYSNKTIYSFVDKFRNGIAHQNLLIEVNEDRVIYIVIFNKYPCNSKCKVNKCKEKGLNKLDRCVVDFKIKITVKELQKIALYIADSYLKAIKGSNDI